MKKKFGKLAFNSIVILSFSVLFIVGLMILIASLIKAYKDFGIWGVFVFVALIAVGFFILKPIAIGYGKATVDLLKE